MNIVTTIGRLVVLTLTLQFALLLAPQAALHAAAPPAKSNLLLIYSDDHGWADLGIQVVDQDIRTPQFDQLAFIGDNGAPLGNAWDGSINLPMVGQKGMVADQSGPTTPAARPRPDAADGSLRGWIATAHWR